MACEKSLQVWVKCQCELQKERKISLDSYSISPLYEVRLCWAARESGEVVFVDEARIRDSIVGGFAI